MVWKSQKSSSKSSKKEVSCLSKVTCFSPKSVKFNSKLGLFGYGNILMAAVGPSRQSRVSMSVSMSLVQGGAAGASATGAVLGMSKDS